MGKRRWVVAVNGEKYTVEARWNFWQTTGEVLIDGRVVDAWGASLFSSPLKFNVAGKEAILHHPDIITSKCQLFVDGTKVRRA